MRFQIYRISLVYFFCIICAFLRQARIQDIPDSLAAKGRRRRKSGDRAGFENSFCESCDFLRQK